VIDPRWIFCGCTFFIAIVVALQFRSALARTIWHSPPAGAPAGCNRVSVIVPARNEAADLGPALESVLWQHNVELEVIVINDHSSDETGAIAEAVAQRDPRVRVLHDPELRPGWLGKASAMQHGVALATSEILLFTDADIIFGPHCFAAAMIELERRQLDFLSLFPRIDCVSIWENINLPCLVGGFAMFATPAIEDPRSSDALAAGAFLLIRAAAFQAIGGFEPIKGAMLDDVELARLVKRNGRSVGFYLAPDLLEVQLYKDNHHAFWGMTKNVLTGLNGRLWLAPFVVLLPLLVFGVPLYSVVSGIVRGDLVLAIAGAGTYALQYATFWMGRKLFRFHPAKALLFPLCAISVICCMGRALYLYTVQGAVQWRGRTVRVRDQARSG
jgi:glycosyltransferase involved in cell wall biosynthesis